jgi:hypothetical protein
MGFIMLRKVAGENLPVRQAGTGNGGQASIVGRFIVPRFNDRKASPCLNNLGT